MPPHDQTAPDRLVDGLDLELRGNHAFGDAVNQRSERRGHAHAVDCLNVSVTQPCMVQAEYVRNGGHPPEPWRHCHVQFRRHHVGEIVQCQCGRVTEDPLWLVLAIPRPELPDHEVGPGWRWKLRQPVHAAGFADPVARLHLVRVYVVPVPGFTGLARGKEAPLRLSRFVKSSEG